MANELIGVGKHAVEDGVEDFFQSFIYRRMNKLTKPFLQEFKSDSEFDEAMHSFISTLSQGISLYAFTKITSFFFERGVKLGGFLWGYIVAGKLKKKVLERLKNSKFKGSRGFRTMALILDTDRTSERIEVAKMVQENVKSYDMNKFHFQNQNMAQQSSLNSMSLVGMSARNSIHSNDMELILFKTQNAEWTNSVSDKKLFERATGKTIAQSGQGGWSSYYKKLNTYTELYKTLDGEVSNLSTMLGKVLARSGAVR